MIELILTAILRKSIFAGFIYFLYKSEKRLFGGKEYDTDSEIGKDPIATAIIIGCVILSLAIV